MRLLRDEAEERGHAACIVRGMEKSRRIDVRARKRCTRTGLAIGAVLATRDWRVGVRMRSVISMIDVQRLRMLDLAVMTKRHGHRHIALKRQCSDEQECDKNS